MEMYTKLVVVFFALTAFTNASALTYEKAYRLIAEQGESLNYTKVNHGALCEVLAVAKMKELYPSATIISGIKYGPYQGSTTGELDVVVFEDDVASMIIEVKCSKKYYSAAAKADRQLARFRGVAGNCNYSYWGEWRDYSCENFQGSSPIYTKMSYEDASEFELDFDLTRTEILQLIDDLSF